MKGTQIIELQKSDVGLTGLKLGCWQDSVLSGGSQGESVFLPFLVSRGCLLSCGPFHLQRQQRLAFLTQHHSQLTLLLPLVRTLMLTLGPPRPSGIVFLLLPLLPSAVFIPLCHVSTYPQASESRTWALWGALFCLPQSLPCSGG